MDTTMTEPRQKATLFQALRMVLWGFIGIRKRVAHEKVEVTPLQIIIIGVIAGAIFVGTLVSVVQWVTR